VINACNVALLNSGVEMRSTMAAVHCVLDDKDNLIIDPIDYSDDTPTFSRIQKAVRNSKYKADFTFVFESIKESVISVNTNGTFTIHQYNNALKLCKQASKKIFEFYCDLARKYANVI
jgi:exosome complex component RRP46